ncbi:hypothetical protein CYMTET_14734 [Cymbomonas tetramitiformis]|uniref:Uncharacterized protein n=1 Tax=Cymbomonas tetramitiformis TaxID=36881 RepID=A0AAE0LA33_9CHLO|nr:hypothetical protein CYMTET_14734 [Cymbomonas tetramitiformis]
MAVGRMAAMHGDPEDHSGRRVDGLCLQPPLFSRGFFSFPNTVGYWRFVINHLKPTLRRVLLCRWSQAGNSGRDYDVPLVSQTVRMRGIPAISRTYGDLLSD